MITLIKNIGRLYSADTERSYGVCREVGNCALLLEDDTISRIYPEPEPLVPEPDLVVDGEGKTVIPGFVDAHTHPVFWKTRESEFILRIEGKSYEEIAAAGGGIRNSARDFRDAAKEDIKDVTKHRLQTFLEYGTTTIEAKSGYGLSLESEIKALEVISELNTEQPLTMVPTFLGAHEVPDEYRQKRGEYINLLVNTMLPEVARRKLAGFCDIFCEKGVFNLAETRVILEAAKAYGLSGRIHADELHPFGAAELAADLQTVTADHLVNVSEMGIKMMADAGVIPVLLPATTFFLRKDIYAPARKMLAAGCDVALATDFNPGSAMTQNMQLVWTIGALKLGMLPGELLWATTYIPAKSLLRENQIGLIEIGKQADLIVLNIPNLDYLPYHMGVNHVFYTIKKGKVVYRKNRYD